MFMMTFNDDGKPIVGNSSCLEGTHHLKEKNKAKPCIYIVSGKGLLVVYVDHSWTKVYNFKTV